MSPQQYQRATDLFVAVCELQPAERSSYLRQACADDPALLARVEALVATDSQQAAFMRQPVLDGVRVSDLMDDPLADDPIMRQGVVGQYTLVRKIGEGGMGTVYEARQEQPRRTVAIKMLRCGLASRSLTRRFQQEIHFLGRLQHPAIAQIFEAATINVGAGTQPYFTMEYVNGLPLTEYAAEHKLSPNDRLDLFARVCDAVQYAHQRGVIHRDLKPGNILVTSGDDPADQLAHPRAPTHNHAGIPKILDFGVARAVETDGPATTLRTDLGQLVGTLPYMSPEQIEGGARMLDTRSDVYSLGIVLFELLTGRLPHDLRGHSLASAARVVQDREPPRISLLSPVLRGDVEVIVSKALEKNREQRYQSAADLAADIRRHLSHEPITARSASLWYQSRKFARRHRALVLGSAATLLALIAGLIGTATYAIRAERQRQNADASARAARRNEIRATQSESAMRRALYQMSTAVAAEVMDDIPTQAEQHLQSAPPDLRNWEWRYLREKLNAGSLSISGPDREPAFVLFARLPPCSALSAPTAPLAPAADPDLVHPAALAVFASGPDIVISDLATGAECKRLQLSADQRRDGQSTPQSILTLASMSPTASHAAAIADNGHELLVVDVVSQQVAMRASLPGEPITMPAVFSPDARVIAVQSGSCGVQVFDASTGASVGTVPPWATSISRPVAFDRSGQALLTLDITPDLASSRVRLTDFARQRQRCECTIASGINTAALSPDGATIALGTRMQIVLVDAGTGLERARIPITCSRPQALRYSPDGARLMFGTEDSTVCVLDLATRKVRRFVAHREVQSLAVSPDGHWLAAGTIGAAVRWNLGHASPRVLTGHSTYVYCVAISPDGRHAATGGWDETIRVWEVATGAHVATVATDGYIITQLAFTPDGRRLCWKSSNRTPGRWIELETLLTGQPDAVVHGTPIDDDVAHFPWHFVNGGAKAVLDGGGERLALSHDRKLLARGTNDGGVSITYLANGSEYKQLTGHTGRVLSVAFSPDDRRVVSGGADYTVRVWDAATGQCLASMPGHLARVFSVNFSPDGTRIASGGDDNVIMLWDAEHFERVFTLIGHTGYVHSVAFTPNGAALISASGDGTVRVWDAGTGETRN